MNIQDFIRLAMFAASLAFLVYLCLGRIASFGQTTRRAVLIRVGVGMLGLPMLGYLLGSASTLKNGHIAGVFAYVITAFIYVLLTIWSSGSETEQTIQSEPEHSANASLRLTVLAAMLVGIGLTAWGVWHSTETELLLAALFAPLLSMVAALLIHTGIHYKQFGIFLVLGTLGAVAMAYMIHFFESQH